MANKLPDDLNKPKEIYWPNKLSGRCLEWCYNRVFQKWMPCNQYATCGNFCGKHNKKGEK